MGARRRPARRRHAAVRHRQAGPRREGPDHHQLGGLQAPLGQGRDRHAVARHLGDHPVPGRGEEGRREPRRHRLHAVPGPGGRQRSARPSAPTTTRPSTSTPKHKEAARAWIDWFTDKSGYAEDNLAISPLKDAPLPDGAEAVRRRGREVHRAGRRRGREGQADRQRSPRSASSSPSTARTSSTSPAARARAASTTSSPTSARSGPRPQASRGRPMTHAGTARPRQRGTGKAAAGGRRRPPRRAPPRRRRRAGRAPGGG